MSASGRGIEDRLGLDTVVDLVVGPRPRPLEGLTVNRVWPTPRRRLIGPFIFFDHLELVDLPPGMGLDVPPHPHIGIATVTWLFEGELMHADSLGVRQSIRPGELNWMTAGQGIAHSERTTAHDRRRASRIHGIQAWVALPTGSEASTPTFEHVGSADVPLIEMPGVRLRLIAGEAYGQCASVSTASALFYIEAEFEGGSELDFPPDIGERGIYIVSGQIEIDGFQYQAGRMLVLDRERACNICAREAARVMLLGGESLNGDRAIWWNFVSSDGTRIEAAKRDWAAGRFPKIPGESDFMPLPG